MQYIRKVKRNRNGTFNLVYVDIDPQEVKQAATKEQFDRIRKKLEKGAKVKLTNVVIDENEEVYLPEEMPTRIKAEAKDRIIKLHRQNES